MMSWNLDLQTSDSGEVPGQESMIGFRGTRFSVAGSRLYVTDYSGGKTYYEPESEAAAYIRQVRNSIVDAAWSGRFRIRYGGDTYCKVRGGVRYVGKTNFGDNENFPGYSFMPGPKPPPMLYSGPHNHGQVGERWTIPESGFAARKGAIGNVGIKASGSWTWSVSKHQHLINSLRSMFGLEDFIRIYITCYGQIIRPVQEKFWNAYRIPVQEQFREVNGRAPAAARSIRERLSRANPGKTTFYFVCGHVDYLMSGRVPQVDTRDGKSRQFDEDGR
jgi:hypothetical protein